MFFALEEVDKIRPPKVLLRRQKMKKTRRMSEREFAAVKKILPKSFSEERVIAAYEALVLDKNLQDIGDKYGWTRQGVSDCVRVVWEYFSKFKSALSAWEDPSFKPPPTWEYTTICAPKELIEKFRDEVKELERQQHLKKAIKLKTK